MQFLIENSCFIFANIFLIQTIGIPMGTDPFLFWPNFYLYNYEYKCIANITRKINLSGRRFHGIF